MQEGVTDHLHFVSEEGLQEAMKLRGDGLSSPILLLSKEKPTYIFFYIRLPNSPHLALVALTTVPTPHPKWGCQVYYSSYFQCWPCCCQWIDSNSCALVTKRVQDVYDAYYRPCQWDFSCEEWYVIAYLVSLHIVD